MTETIWPAATGALAVSDALLRTLTDAMPQMVWSTRPDGFHDYYNAQWYAFTGVPEGSTDGEAWNGMFHPEDQDRAWTQWRHSLATGEPYEIEYRLRHHSGEYRWALGRALPVRDADGTINRWIGTCTDIDAAKRAAERHELLNRELDHRIKNLFAVVGSLVSLSGRAEPAMAPLATELQARLAALAAAHALVRPHAARPPATLQALLRDLLRPYPAFDDGRLTIGGDDPEIGAAAATPLALAFHEMATNATKYGGLSTATGRLAVFVAANAGTVTIDWTERGGPAPAAPPGLPGFGTQLADLSIRRQLGGRIDRDWGPAGLRMTLAVPAERLAAAA